MEQRDKRPLSVALICFCSRFNSQTTKMIKKREKELWMIRSD